MVTLLKVINESILQAFSQLAGNKLRSFLSLLGITIGIFCIVGVKSAVDSLEGNIRGSFDKLGNDVVYVDKFDWGKDPGEDFWKYMRRPSPSFVDYEKVTERVKTANYAAFHVFIGLKTVKFNSNSVDRTEVIGVTDRYTEMFNLNFDKGRFFSRSEYERGLSKCVIGHKVATELFGPIEPLGKTVKLMGRKMEVIGVLEKTGKDIISILDFDDAVLLSYEFAKKFANLKTTNRFGNSMLSIKAKTGVDLENMKDELTSVLRSQRRLKPRDENNFALNELSILSKVLDGFFGVLNLIGLIIGGFAILVGAFSVANIMFVSVKERTNIIGIKKALGAKRYIILLEFLIESIILCIIGGLIGLAFIFFVAKILTAVLEFEIALSFANIVYGLIWSVGIGVLAGIIPAYIASGMDPVEAIRQ